MDELDEIVEKIKAGECIPFIGAGVSINAGCKGWDYIPSELEKAAQDILTANPTLLPEGLSKQQKIRILGEELIKSGKSHEYERILRAALSCKPADVQGKYLTLVSAIKRIFGFSGIMLTTNIDNCLDLTPQFSPENKYPPLFRSVDQFKIIKLSQGGLYHIHGHYSELMKAAFTDVAYKERYDQLSFENFLCHIFKAYTVLFIGYSFSDDPLMNIIAEMKGKQHFALVRKKPELTPEIKTSFLERYNIKMIEYSDHDVLPNLLQQWVDKNFPEISATETEKEDVTHV